MVNKKIIQKLQSPANKKGGKKNEHSKNKSLQIIGRCFFQAYQLERKEYFIKVKNYGTKARVQTAGNGEPALPIEKRNSY